MIGLELYMIIVFTVVTVLLGVGLAYLQARIAELETRFNNVEEGMSEAMLRTFVLELDKIAKPPINYPLPENRQ